MNFALYELFLLVPCEFIKTDFFLLYLNLDNRFTPIQVNGAVIDMDIGQKFQLEQRYLVKVPITAFWDVFIEDYAFLRSNLANNF